MNLAMVRVYFCVRDPICVFTQNIFWMLCIDYLIRPQAVADKPLPSVQELSIVKFQIFRKAFGNMHISIHNCSVNVVTQSHIKMKHGL